MALPSELEILAVPPLASMTVLNVALEMIVAVIHCEHPDIDEIPTYFASDEIPPDCLCLAQTICERALDLSQLLAKYCAESRLDLRETTIDEHDYPF